MTTHLTADQLGTIRLALLEMEARYKQEAKAMRLLAESFGEQTEDKCIANAEASDQFAVDARAILSGPLFQ